MKIESLSKWHYPGVIEQLIQFGSHTGLNEYINEAYDQDYAKKILLHCQLSGVNFVAIEEDRVIGMILSMRDRDLWMPSVIRLREVCWWVEEQYRGTAAGARLFLEYNKGAEKMLTCGLIRSYSISRMASSPEFNFEGRGFSPLESTWIKGAV